jgi:hypothetical protein
MNTSIVIKENRTQLVLQPESDHDKAVLEILEKLPNTSRLDFYDTQGGYTRFSTSGHQDDLAIVFDEKVIDLPTEGVPSQTEDTSRRNNRGHSKALKNE